MLSLEHAAHQRWAVFDKMKKLIGLLKKDLLLFIRDRKNILLVILTPIVIMTILGNVFSGTTKEEFLKNIKLGYCSYDPEFSLTYPFSLFTYQNDCINKTKAAVSSGKMRGTIIISETFTSNIKEGYGSEIMLDVDNAKPQTAFAVTTAMEAFVNAMNEQIGVTFIREAWDNLHDLDRKLAFAAENLEGTKHAALLLEERTQNLSAGIEIINVSAAEDIVDKADEQANDTLSKLNMSLPMITEFEPSIRILADTIDILPLWPLQNLTASYGVQCVSCMPNCTIPSFMCASINESLIRSAIYDDKTAKAKHMLKVGIENLSAGINKTNELVVGYEQLVQDTIAHTAANISNLEDSLARVREKISVIDAAQQNAKEKLDEISNLTRTYTQEIVALQESLNKTAHFLAVYTKRDPRSIVRAVTLKSSETFPAQKPFKFMAPGLIVIVLMLITFLISSAALVAERKSSTMLRNMLSPMPLAIFIAEKMLFILALCFVQILLMLAVNAFFNVFFPFSLHVWMIFLLISAFLASFGMLLGAMSYSENTALLSSLVVSIPLMFLAGVFFAFESMPKQMAMLGAYSPITMAVSLLESTVTYMTPLNQLYIDVLLGLTIMFFGLTYVLVKRSPTIE